MLMNSARLFADMKKQRLDAIVATMPENVTYASGFWAMSQWIRRGPQAYVLTPAQGNGEAVVIASTGLIDLAADPEVWVKDISRFGRFVIDSTPEIGALLICETDFDIAAAGGGDVSLTRDQTIMQGAPSCTFRYRFAPR